MIEQVLSKKNMRIAYQQVLRNKGSAGVDGMRVHELYAYAATHRENLCASILQGHYLPQPILGVSIPKGNGKMRLLGIPTVVDRWLQQSVAQVDFSGSRLSLFMERKCRGCSCFVDQRETNTNTPTVSLCHCLR